MYFPDKNLSVCRFSELMRSALEKAGEKGDVDPEEMKRLSAFADFIKTLDMGDIDKGKDKDKGKS